MNLEQVVECLHNRIDGELRGAVDGDYMLLGVPYYVNIGDILLWQGELDFLNTVPHRHLNQGFRYNDHWRIGPDTFVVLQGGGNFGDLWRWVQEERLGIIERCPNNPILIFPVTCHYEDSELMKRDAETMSRHPHLTICARDRVSYEMLTRHFDNKILLVPDMAFAIDRRRLLRNAAPKGKGTVFVKRRDKELASSSDVVESCTAGADVREWPSYERDPLCWSLYMGLRRLANRVGRVKQLSVLKKVAGRLSDSYFHIWCRQSLIRMGVRFVSGYEEIFTTRLHVAILAILLDKPVTIIDNSYGKNSSLFETWLSNVDGVRMIK